MLIAFHHNYDIKMLKDRLLLAIGVVPGNSSTPAIVVGRTDNTGAERAHALEIFQSPVESNEEEVKDFETLLDELISEKEVDG